jgi:uncharacterized protein YuzE
MKVNYHPETDSLYIDLSEQPGVESREISDGVLLDYDESGNLVGIDIDNASRKVDLQRFVVSRIPARVVRLTNFTFDRTDGSHSLAGAGQRER